MKLPTLRPDTAAAIRKATQLSSESAAKLTSLRNRRAELITAADDAVALAEVDTEIGRTERLIAATQETIRALDAKQKRERTQDRLAEGAKAVDAFAKDYLKYRYEPAAHIVFLLQELGDAYASYKETRNLPFHNKWRTDLFGSYVGDRFSPLQPVDTLLNQIIIALDLNKRTADIRLSEARVRTEHIAVELKEAADRYLEILREAPLPSAPVEPVEAA
ncbi:MAG: hypothetical protein WCD69_12015 [Xanthobacteraceae bacterium]